MCRCMKTTTSVGTKISVSCYNGTGNTAPLTSQTSARELQMSLLMLFSAFTGSRPATLLADDSSEEPKALAYRA